MIQLTNDNLAVNISEKGAELQSIMCNNIEYLWQANAAYWPKHAPVLFPVVGELKDGEYIYNDKKYKLSRHGFARDKTFEAKQHADNSATFLTSSNEETLAVYPFEFIFSVYYTLNNTKLICTYNIKNTGNRDMYFSIGGHPAFKVPLVKDLKYNDYFLEFNNDEYLQRYLLHKGLTGNETEKIDLENKRLRLQHSLFYTDAIVLKNIKSNTIKLSSDKDEHGLIFSFDNFSYFGIWAAVDAPFVCLEPWCGIADSIRHDKQLTHKEGINKLAANDSWQRTWSVELF